MSVKIGDPAGAKRDSVKDMLRQICPEADLQVGADGVVATKEADFCTRVRDAPRQPPCKCICVLIASGKTVTIIVKDDLSVHGGGRTDDANPNDTSNGKGSDETVNIENRDRYRQKRRDNGEWMDVPDWISLAHELCGHALPGTRGDHPEWRPTKPGFKKDWHRQSEEAEDEIRKARGLPPRGTKPGLKPK